jgi:type IV pilus assembly protein PilF
VKRLARWVAVGALAAALAGCAGVDGLSSEGGEVRTHVGENREAAKVNTELAAGYMREGQIKVAVEKIERAMQYDRGYGPAYHVHALLMQRLGEDGKAAKSFARAERLEGDNPELANNYGGFLCARGEYERGQALLARAYEDPLYETPAYALVNSGRCYQRAGDNARALEQYRRALDEGARRPAALLGLAEVLLETGAPAEAAEAMQRYEAQHRHSPRSLAVAMRIDKAVGDEQAWKNHRLILRGRFPESPEAKALENGS